MDHADLVETLAHKLLAEKRMNGEWFRVSLEEAVSAINQAIRLIEANQHHDLLGTSPREPQPIRQMTPDTLKAWQDRLGVSQITAATHLAVPIPTYRHWLSGRRSIPDSIERLCRYVETFGPLG